MVTTNVYLNFMGNTEDAFNFYKSVFGNEFTVLQRFRDTPAAEQVPEHEKDKVMHVALPVGNGNVLMGTDALESMGQKLLHGNNVSISLNVDSDEEAEKFFNGLSAGGKIEVPLQKMFWNAYFGMFTDRFGIQWMVNHDYSK